MSKSPSLSLKSFVDDQKNKAGSSSSLASLLSGGLNGAAGLGTQLGIKDGSNSIFNAFKSFQSNLGFTKLNSDPAKNGSSPNSRLSSPGSSKDDGDWFSDSAKKENGHRLLNLTRTQRIVGFAFCLLAGFICFGLAFLYVPVLVLKARKFGALYSLGSCFLISSFALLRGVNEYLKQSFSQPRLPITLSYFGSLFATLYCSLWIRNTILTVICVIVQMITLTWFLVSYVPGGEKGLRFISSVFSRLVRRKAGSVLPV